MASAPTSSRRFLRASVSDAARGLDERSKIRFRVLPYVPRAFNQSGIADKRAGLIGGRFLVSEGGAEVALTYGNLIGPCPVMERLAQFVNRQFLHC